MGTDDVPPFLPPERECRIGPSGAFVSPAAEAAFRRQNLRDDRSLCGILVIAGMGRVLLAVLAGYPTPDAVLAARLLLLLLSAGVLVGMRRASTPAHVDRLFVSWGCVFAAVAVYGLSARPPDETWPLFVSFSFVLVAFCVTPLPLSRQAPVVLAYAAGVFAVSRHAEGATLGTLAVIYAAVAAFGAVTSRWRNRLRRRAFLAEVREARLRADLEAAAAEIRTLRGLLCICAWCKRVRDEEETWQPVERYVQTRTAASFTHGICPACMESQVDSFAQSTP
jgi:hypothetical protein